MNNQTDYKRFSKQTKSKENNTHTQIVDAFIKSNVFFCFKEEARKIIK